jgi:hypothetical protein
MIKLNTTKTVWTSLHTGTQQNIRNKATLDCYWSVWDDLWWEVRQPVWVHVGKHIYDTIHK